MTKESLPYRGHASKEHLAKHVEEWKCPYCSKKGGSDVDVGLEHVSACSERPADAPVLLDVAVPRPANEVFIGDLKQI